MTTTSDTTAAASSLLSDYSISNKTSTTDATGESSTLDKDSFLQLLVTQLQNQNPLDPTDNTEFVAQLAQFSSLEAMQNLNTSVTSITDTLSSSQALQASSLVGRSVTVQTDTVKADTSSGSYSVTGSFDLSAAATATTVNVYDSEGNIVKNIDLGAQNAGTVDFTWDGTDNDGNVVDSGTYTFKATATQDGTEVAQTTYLPSTVSSVSLSSTNGMTLNLANGDSVSLSEVSSIGI